MEKKRPAHKTDPDLQNRLGGVIRRRRHQLGMTQEELAWRAGMHRTYIADVERGSRNVTLRVIANLARALDVSVGYLFTDAGALPETALHLGAGPVPKKRRDILKPKSANRSTPASSGRSDFSGAKRSNSSKQKPAK